MNNVTYKGYKLNIYRQRKTIIGTIEYPRYPGKEYFKMIRFSSPGPGFFARKIAPSSYKYWRWDKCEEKLIKECKKHIDQIGE